MSDDAQQRRRRHYAQCTAELIRGPDGGHAALFDQAISNALAAIVAAEQPERLLRKDGKVHAAQQLLDVVTDIGQAEPDGAVSLAPEPVDSEGVVHIDRFLGTTRPTGVRVDVPRLRDAINSTGGTRHGSGGTPLNDDVINALRVLDDHPALCVLDDYLQGGSEQRTVDEDKAERRRAAEYWAERYRRTSSLGGGPQTWRKRDRRLIRTSSSTYTIARSVAVASSSLNASPTRSGWAMGQACVWSAATAAANYSLSG